jgi:hypothetical protein
MTEPALRFLSLGIELSNEDKDVLEKVHAALDRLTRRRKSQVPVSLAVLEETLREALLYRIVATASGAIVSWNTKNVLCSFLAARALLETFAFLWDYDRAISQIDQTGTGTELYDLTRKRLIATRNPEWIKNNPEWSATNIATFIKRLSQRYPSLGVAYDQMSYRCHPNTEGIFYTFVGDVKRDTKVITFADHNETAGWAFRLIFAVVCHCVIETGKILDRLEYATPKIAEVLKKIERQKQLAETKEKFAKQAAEAERKDKEFAELLKEEKKALQGDAGAQYNLGTAHAAGFHLPKNLVGAHFWFSLSAAQGNEEAIKARDKIEPNMTPTQIAEAKAQATEWKPLTPEQIAEIENYYREWQPEAS